MREKSLNDLCVVVLSSSGSQLPSVPSQLPKREKGA